MNTILLTGGLGFIGSHTLVSLCDQMLDWRVVNVDLGTYAARPPLYLKRPENLVEERVDIRDQFAVNRLITKYSPTHVIHMAAESHVCRSIAGPKDFVTTNILGTFNMLEESREIGGRFIHVSTDEVFGEISKGAFSEDSPVLPRNPYAATKASSDLLARAYHETYGMDIVTVRMANNFGPNQHEEKLVPNTVRAILEGRKVLVHGKGDHVRQWLYVKDAAEGVIKCIHSGKPGSIYTLPGEIEMTNIDMIKEIWETVCALSPSSGYHLGFDYQDARPTDDCRYAMTGELAKRHLGWNPKRDFKDKLAKTVKWYMDAMLHGRRA